MELDGCQNGLKGRYVDEEVKQQQTGIIAMNRPNDVGLRSKFGRLGCGFGGSHGCQIRCEELDNLWCGVMRGDRNIV